MRLNERHAAIAVLFLVVILLVGFFWQDDSADPPPAGADQHLARQVEAPASRARSRRPSAPIASRPRGGAPLGGLDEVPDHGRARFGPRAPGRGRAQRGARRVGSSDQPRGLPAPSGTSMRARRGYASTGFRSARCAGAAARRRPRWTARGPCRAARPRVTADASSFEAGPALDQVETAASTRDERVAWRPTPEAKPAARPPAPAAREYTVRSGDSSPPSRRRSAGPRVHGRDLLLERPVRSQHDQSRHGAEAPPRRRPRGSPPGRVASKAPVATGGRRR